jgi:hypothetical protein
MRSLGVTRIDAYCACGYQASIDVSALPGDLAVPSIKNRLRCCVALGRWRPGRTGRSTRPKDIICQTNGVMIDARSDSSPYRSSRGPFGSIRFTIRSPSRNSTA